LTPTLYDSTPHAAARVSLVILPQLYHHQTMSSFAAIFQQLQNLEEVKAIITLKYSNTANLLPIVVGAWVLSVG
jgi:hypothetical protein